MQDRLYRFESMHALDVANARKKSSAVTFLEKNKNQVSVVFFCFYCL